MLSTPRVCLFAFAVVSLSIVGHGHGFGPERTVTVWPRTAVPATISNNDSAAVELGMKFRSQVPGVVTGVMFYKGAANIGLHSGSVWSSSGTRLATVTFTDETASGWQVAYFSTAVTVLPNTTYVVSYHTEVGRYSSTSYYFAGTSGGTYNFPVTALASGVDGNNGVYKYGPSEFPNQSYQNTNYWVDVVFAHADAGSQSVYPSSTTIETGTFLAGETAALHNDDDAFYQVTSTTSGTRTASWYAAFVSVPNEALGLRIGVKGKNSRNSTETISIYNWTTASWTPLDSRAVGTTELLRTGLAPGTPLSDYVSGSAGLGEVRIQVRSTANANFTTSTDLLTLSYDPAPYTGVRPVITAPTEGQGVTGSTVNVTYTTMGDPASVGATHIHFILDSQPPVEESPLDGSYQFANVAAGSHVLKAFFVRADNSYIPGTDAVPVAFTAGATGPPPPKPVITSPTSNQVVPGSSFDVTYTYGTPAELAAVGADHIHFVLDSNPQVMDSPMDGIFRFTEVAPGAHVLRAFYVRVDHSYIPGTDAAPVSFTTTAGPLPRPVITAPVSGQTLNGASITVTYSITGDPASAGASHIHFVLDSGPAAMETPTDGTYTYTNVPAGQHTLEAFFVRSDHSKIVGTDAVPVLFSTEVDDSVPPLISITSPAGGASVSGAVNTTVNTTDNTAVVGVQYLLDGGNINTEVTTPPFSAQWSSAIYPSGQHILTARARDAAGNTTISAPVGINIFNTSPAGLVAAFSFNEASGNATLDSSGRVNNGVASNITRVPGRYGNGLMFNGTSSLVSIANSPSLDLSTGMTVEAWVSPNALSSFRAVVTREFSSTDAWALLANDNGSRPGAFVRTGSTTGPLSGARGSAQLPLNSWTHIAGTYDGTQLRFYENGALVSSTAIAGAIAQGANALTLGASSIWGEYFSGIIDEVRIYNRALTAVEVQNDMSSPIALPGGPKLIINSPVQNQTISGLTLDITYSTTGDLASAEVDHAHFVLDANPYRREQPMDGVLQFTDVSPGTHTLTGFLVKANHVYVPGTEATPVTFTTVGTDTVPPTVSIALPASGSTLSGAATVTATASDNTGVLGVQFLIDGVDLGSEVTQVPYSWTWNSAAFANGPHILTARARDASGNTTVSAPVSISISNGSDPSATGSWSAPVSWPIVSVHTALTHTGEVLGFEGVPGLDGAGRPGGTWNPSSGAFTLVQDPLVDLFCAGHVALPDGRILVVGGHGTSQIGIADVNIFNPTTRTWTTAPPMNYRRWYPTATVLPDGRVLVTSGADLHDRDYVPIPEVYNPVTNSWTTLPAANLRIPAYPHMFVLPDGKLAYVGTDEAPTGVLTFDVASQVWTTVEPSAAEGGSSVMYEPGRFMKSGMAGDDPNVRPAVASTYVIDLNTPTPRWQQTADMAFARAFHNLTLLPDGTVLTTSGSRRTDSTQPVYEAELWSPATRTWTTLARAGVPRMYHSSALLLPDGRVLVGGGGRIPGLLDQRSYELYSPPYLFKGPRPVVSSLPDVLNYGSGFFIGSADATNIASVILMRLGSMTHQINMDQRRLPLTFVQVPGGLTVQAPANGNHAPPGYYMVFVLNSAGVPSVGRFVRFPAPYEDLLPPTAPTDLQATGGLGTASLTWTAATDNLGVTRYNVHRSAALGFVPSAANRIAQPVSTSYVDTNLAAGRYFYRVTAEDTAGNTGPPSNEVVVDVLGDTIPPSVSLTNPAAGLTVSGSVVLTADASDDQGVAGVQFLLNGLPLGAEDTTLPYSLTWNSAGVANGPHQLAARARDTGGNLTTSGPVSIITSNSAPSGLVVAMSFNEASGATVSDTSGTDNHGSIANAVRVPGKYGNGLSFNGTNSFVTITGSPSLNLTTGMTVEAWANPATLSSFRVIFTKEMSGTDAWALNANDNGSLPGMFIRTGSSTGPLTGALGNSQLPLNTWTHVAGTYDGSQLRFYVNGVLVTTTAVTGSIATAPNPLRIGGNSIWGEWFNGLIDEVRVYSRALTQSEIQADMNAPLP